MTRRYQILFNRRYLKDLERIPAQFRSAIQRQIEGLSMEPRPPGCKKLKGSDLYRVRCGDYRIVYEIHDNILQIVLIDIGHRKEIYR